ncbi:MAG: hypothetical protein B7C24_07555 [Bacteroidetes bacterium 4572_77]|nr:MAG: hypothetical protein B7C24_07555 [Bacteroidetes bacterium 4572_77]
MAQAKKFGTFAGVFTPSILTILGVIMYLRLGWVVGTAGLYSALLLIIIAHVISISTGLSLSSIATDKKIKTGGIYYMLSRSLGLPMGGSIGITLFLGTALSISLYIVGFVENFLSISAINEFLGMSGSVNDIRIIGTFVIIFLVILAYISTSIAIKTQFVILGAIALSLVSIVVGIFMNYDSEAIAGPALLPIADAPDLMVIFAVFFPAVTGFTAGVAMSGDLKSPKGSIPKGTLMSIGVGLLVYLGLTFLFAFYIDRDLLVSDTNFLQKIAWMSPLVIAGIWGATLSSALGGILGAPRILQAMSTDKVTPSFFAKGVGLSKEPRRALIFTFLLAEGGILIGQLDVIAGIVSMFYIAAYGFINLAYVLERWANSDFRPSMKISIWIGIIGFVASMGVMLKLDTMGMLVAFGIMFGIYAYLKRKELQGNMTDVWQSVWTSLVRTSLNRINEKPLNESNWQPNIVLFSGGGNARPHLLEFGVDVAGSQGFLSNFDLHINKEAEYLFPKSAQKIPAGIDEKYEGIFTRRQSVRNLYEGIEMIAQTYGFSGVEPNTVMMGWARQSEDPQRFAKLVYNLATLDLNVVLLDYDKTSSWGKKESIDIWWRGGGNNGNLALSLAKFITINDEWSSAQIRLLIVNEHNDKSASIYDDAAKVLDNLRIHAEIRIINNEIEQRSFYDIIQLESINTDLTFLGFPKIQKGEEKEFVERINSLCADIGTVAIIQAASEFKDIILGNSMEIPKLDLSKTDSSKKSENILQSLDFVQSSAVRNHLQSFVKSINNIAHSLSKDLITPITEIQNHWLNQLEETAIRSFDNLMKRAENAQNLNFHKSVKVQHQIFLRSILQYVKEEKSAKTQEILSANVASLQLLSNTLQKDIKKLPYRIKTKLSKSSLNNISESDKRFVWPVRRLRALFLLSSKIPYYVHFRELILTHYPQSVYQLMYRTIVNLNRDSYRFENEIFKAQQRISSIFESTEEMSKDSTPSQEELAIQKEQVLSIINTLKEQRQQGLISMTNEVEQLFVDDLDHLILQLNYPIPNAFLNRKDDVNVLVKRKKKKFLHSIDTSLSNKILIDNVNQLNLLLLSFKYNSQNALFDLNIKLNNTTKDSIVKPLKQITQIIEQGQKKDKEEQEAFVSNKFKELHLKLDVQIQQSYIDQYNYSLKKIKSSLQGFPDQLSIYTDSSMFTDGVLKLQALQSIDVALKRTLDFMMERELMEIREALINMGQDINSLKTEIVEIMQRMMLLGKDGEDAKSEYLKSIDTNLEYNELLALTLDRLKGIEEIIANKQDLLHGIIQKKIQGFKVSLELYPFIRSIQDLKQYIKTAQTKRWFSKLSGFQKTVHYFISTQLNKLWYNQSSGLLLAQKLSKASGEDQETTIDRLLSFKDKATPKENVLKQIPDYYKQLFLRKQFYLNEFWVGREEEMASFNKSYERWRQGYSGAIMITGERNSGKSFFANYMGQKMDIKGEKYFINPPYAGSISISDFLRNFQEVTEKQGTFSQIFNQIPDKSVFFIDDLELWWEKSTEGMSVIKHLVNIINRYGGMHLFVIQSNIHSFNLINRYQKLGGNFLNVIELRPFNAKKLKEIVIRRHTTSNQEFVMNTIPEYRYRSWNYASLFSRFFKYSGGNPGVALQTWLSAIEEVQQNKLIMKKPLMLDTSLFRYLETEWMIFILHFLLHKRMNLSKLIRVSHESRPRVIKRIRTLQRAGIVISLGDDILDIDPYILPFLRKALVKRELL